MKKLILSNYILLVLKRLSILMLLSFCFAEAQLNESSVFSITPEILIGTSGSPNTNFPDKVLQKQAFVSLGWHHSLHKHKWTQFLKTTKAGFSFGYTDLGNRAQLGYVFTVQPFLEFYAFSSKNIYLHLGTGTSYVTEKYHPVTNEFNKAVSTDLTWSFRLFMYFNLIKYERINWRIGVGYTHYSNGHTRLPNQGYNSFLLSLGAEIKMTKNSNKDPIPDNISEKSIADYFSLRYGYGINVLSEAFNEQKSVHVISAEYGRIFNNTLKVGIGGYIRFYEAYYDYIANNESLVQESREFSDLRSNPFANALNIGITANGEFLLNHIGIDLQVGLNLFKPAYKIDWRINQGWGFVPREIPEPITGNYNLGTFDETYFKYKRSVSARLGLKYYFIGTAEKPTHNFFLGAFINSNLGQADFTEIALGYRKTMNYGKRR